MEDYFKMNTSLQYKNIFKLTFLFGFVQVFNILTKVGLNKAATVFLGAEGIGLIGIFQSISEIFKTFFGFGISESSVRDISKANADKDEYKFSKIITIVNKIIWITAFLGMLSMIFFSSYLSKISFNNFDYVLSFALLSLVVF